MKKVLDETFEGTSFTISAHERSVAQEIIKFARELGATVTIYRAEYNEKTAERAKVRRDYERLLLKSAKAAMAGDNAKADTLKVEAQAFAQAHGIK